MNRYPALSALLAALVWSTNGVLLRLIGLPITTTAFFRSAVPTVIIILWYAWRGYRPSTDSLGIKAVASTLNAIRIPFFYYGFLQTTIANAMITVYTWPIFAAIFGRIILRERVSPARAALLFLAFSGIPLLYLDAGISGAEGSARGISALLLSAALHALIMVLLKRAKPGADRFESVLSQNFVSALVFLPFLWLPRPEYTVAIVGTAIFYGGFIGLVGFALFFNALHRIPAARATNIAYLEVVGATVLAWIIFGEVPGWNTLAGGTLIILSVFLSSRWRTI